MTQVEQAQAQQSRQSKENSDRDAVSTADAVLILREGGMTASVIRPPTPRERNYDESTVIVCPTRRDKFCRECGLSTEGAAEACACGAQLGGRIDFQVLDSWQNMVAPMNQKKDGVLFALEHLATHKTTEQLAQRDGPLIAVGYEVGHAYNALVQGILESPGLKDHIYLMTVEDDNILPWDAHLRLLEAMHFARTEDGKAYDAVSGLYHTKDDGEFHTPLAMGDAAKYRRTGKLDYSPIDLSAYPEDQDVIEVMGLPMGCALWKMSLFREIPGPWFVTKQNEKRNRLNGATQDLYFSTLCTKAGKRLGLVRSVYVGHKAANGEVY